jgi:hypothetical protein
MKRHSFIWRRSAFANDRLKQHSAIASDRDVQ